MPVQFHGDYHCGHDDGTRPHGLFTERAKKKLLDLWHETEVAQYFGNVDVKLHDYRAFPKAASIGPDLTNPIVMYDVVGFIDDETLMLLIMRFNVQQSRPDLPCF